MAVKEFWIYTGLRAALFVASLGVVAGVWMLVSDEVPLLWVIVIAFVVSGLASYFLLNRQREAFARRVERARPARVRRLRGAALEGRRGLARHSRRRSIWRRTRDSSCPRTLESSATRFFQAR